MDTSASDVPQGGIKVQKRQSEILDMVSTKQRVSVKELACDFEVSEVTIRSDLDLLEKEGKLKRVRGGAVLPDRMREVADIARRMEINSEEKRKIAIRANALVSDGDSIAVDSGSTSFEFVKTLSNKKDLTILTHDLRMAAYVDRQLPNASVIVLGGALRSRHGYCWGPLTVEFINEFFVDKAFLGANAFTPAQGFMTESPHSGEVKRALIEHSRESIMLIDSFKIGINSFIRFADIGDLDYVVMDDDPDGIVQQAAGNTSSSPAILK